VLNRVAIQLFFPRFHVSGKRVFQELVNEMLESSSSLLPKEISVSKAIESLQAAQRHAMAVRPKVGGFPYLAEILRRAGVTRNLWFLPAWQTCHDSTRKRSSQRCESTRRGRPPSLSFYSRPGVPE